MNRCASLRDAVDPDARLRDLIRRFYTRWFAADISARDLFPPDMTGSARLRPGAELVVRRTHRPARRGAGRLPRPARPRPPQVRCHRNGITTRCRTRCSPRCARTSTDSWDHRLGRGRARRGGAGRRGDERRRRRRERPAVLRRHGHRALRGHPRRVGGPAATRPPAVLPPRSVRHRPGAAVAAAVALPEPVDPRRPRRRHRVPRPLGPRRHGEHRDRRRDHARRPVAAVQPARRRCTSTATPATC